MKHRHSEVIKAFADGIECEGWDYQNKSWFRVTNISSFDYCDDTRIKPEPKPDVVAFAKVYSYENFIAYIGLAHPEQDDMDNLKITWDGETGELKSTEVLR
jgi:hypothetical protein